MIEAIRYVEGKIELPVKLKVYDSIFVPLAKWAMLLAGNYRCVTKDGMRTAQGAVYSDTRPAFGLHRADLVVKLGAKPEDLVPFENTPRRRKASSVRPRGARAAERRAQTSSAPTSGSAHRQAEGAQPSVIDATVALVGCEARANREGRGVNFASIPPPEGD
jgi:hypothetical protein